MSTVACKASALLSAEARRNGDQWRCASGKYFQREVMGGPGRDPFFMGLCSSEEGPPGGGAAGLQGEWHSGTRRGRPAV